MIRCGRCGTYKQEMEFSPTQRKTGAHCKKCAVDAVRQWRANNPVQAEALRQRQYANQKYKKNGTTTRLIESPYDRAVRGLLYRAKHRAKYLGVAFTLTDEDIVIPSHCPALGIRLSFGDSHKERKDAPTIDRIHNGKGYTPDNIVIVSWRANWLKNNATIDELRLLAKFYCGSFGNES